MPIDIRPNKGALMAPRMRLGRYLDVASRTSIMSRRDLEEGGWCQRALHVVEEKHDAPAARRGATVELLPPADAPDYQHCALQGVDGEPTPLIWLSLRPNLERRQAGPRAIRPGNFCCPAAKSGCLAGGYRTEHTPPGDPV